MAIDKKPLKKQGLYRKAADRTKSSDTSRFRSFCIIPVNLQPVFPPFRLSLPPTADNLGRLNNNDLISDNDLNTLLDSFAAVLPTLPKTDDATASFTVDGTNPTYSNKNYTKAVTISYGGSATTNLGGEIHFDNCTFAAGVTINYSDSAPFAVDFSDSCTVTGVVTVSPGTVENHDLWKNNMVEIWGAKGLAINATAPTQVSCGSCTNEEHFTLNGVTVTGTVGDTENENWFDAVICYVCNGYHADDFAWGENENHANCVTEKDGNTPATTSPEFHLNTGTAGNITATGTGIAYIVRVEGNATISGLTVAQDKEIVLSDNQRHCISNIGANTVYIYDAGQGNKKDSHYGITGTGTVYVRNSDAIVEINQKNLGAPHIFSVTNEQLTEY